MYGQIGAVRANIAAAEIQDALFEGRPVRVDFASLHRHDSDRDWQGPDPVGEQLGELVPVVEGDKYVLLPPQRESGMVQACLWARGELAVMFMPFYLSAGTEVQVGPLPLEVQSYD